jgi:hypothetical protein
LYFFGLILSGLAPRPSTSRLAQYLWNENSGGDSSSPRVTFQNKSLIQNGIISHFQKKKEEEKRTTRMNRAQPLQSGTS